MLGSQIGIRTGINAINIFIFINDKIIFHSEPCEVSNIYKFGIEIYSAYPLNGRPLNETKF